MLYNPSPMSYTRTQELIGYFCHSFAGILVLHLIWMCHLYWDWFLSTVTSQNNFNYNSVKLQIAMFVLIISFQHVWGEARWQLSVPNTCFTWLSQFSVGCQCLSCHERGEKGDRRRGESGEDVTSPAGLWHHNRKDRKLGNWEGV